MAEEEVESNFHEGCCVICELGFESEESVTVSKKGVLTLIDYSKRRERLELKAYLTQCISKTPIVRVLVHKSCRRNFTDQKWRSVKYIAVPCARRLRSSSLSFNWKEDCMFCGKSVTVDSRHPERKVITVTTLPLRCKLLECCDQRGDLWASEVKNHGCIDLVAAEAVYHQKCYSQFTLKRELNPMSKPQGRPQDQGMLQWFEMLLQWLESEAGAELYTLAELQAKMEEFSNESEVYSIKRLKQKLQDHYKEFIFFAA